MQVDANLADVRTIMAEFADRTGLSIADNPPRRYLWTDAHAVCNFLSLYRKTGDDEYRALAVKLVDQVHHVLGKHRDDDPRHGWISGLGERDGEERPTAGGLRIGKTFNERGPNDAYDERLEWDRDGQYFHYLTKWMHALYKVSAVTREPKYCRWAVVLAKAAHAGFARALRPDGRKRLVWKMSIDLTYPLVPSSGLHDPLDGYITYNELGLCRGGSPETGDLATEIVETAAMNEGQRWATEDPLGIGGLLFDACRVYQLIAVSRLGVPGLAEILMRDIRNSLDAFSSVATLNNPADFRLAFRELGLSIGLRAVGTMQSIARNQPEAIGDRLQRDLEELNTFLPLGREIEGFWLEPDHQAGQSWLDHQDINSVMLATCLLPDEFLAL